VKSDVFSFGVLLLETISGKKSKGFYHPDHSLSLIGHVVFKVKLLCLITCPELMADSKSFVCLRHGDCGMMAKHQS
jgi:hypothetical protein